MTTDTTQAATDMLRATQRQRDQAMNANVSMEVQLMAALREIERLKGEIKALKEPVKEAAE